METLAAVIDPEIRRQITELFSRRQREVRFCDSSADAAAALDEASFPFVLVDLDLDDGILDLCRRLGTVILAERSYVIAITSAETPAALRDAIEAGVDDYVASPVSMPGLQIKLALGERNLARRRHRQLEVPPVSTLASEAADSAEVEGLRRREEYFRTLLESTSELVSILDIDGQILYQSPSSRRLLDQPSERMMGANVFEYIHADDRALVHGALHEVMNEAGASATVQARFRQGYGEWAYLESVLENLIDHPVLGGVLMSSRDVSERRRVASALARERAFFRQLFDNSPAGVVILDNQDRVVDANRSWVDLFQYPIDEIAGKPLSDFIVSDALRSEAVELSRLVTERQTVDRETLRRKKDGTDVDVSILGFPIELSDRRIGAYGIYNDITERKQAERKLFHGAFHDALTGLPNRSLLEERLERSLRRAQRRDDYQFALVFLDLDGFKKINDTLGHAAGDELLIEMARRLEGCLRPGDTVARLGGDEFNLLLDDIREVADATHVADRILASLAEPFAIAGQDVSSCSGSLGIAFSAAGYETVEDLMRDADLAMYRAKSQGKARYELVDEALQRQASDRLDQKQEVLDALDAGQLDLAFQPIYALADRRIVGFEALGRWRHPERGRLAAADWLPILRETGEIVRYGRWVIDTAVGQLAEWSGRFPEHEGAMISINMSAEELADSALLDHLDACREEHGVHPAAIAIEMSEAALADSHPELAETLWRLRQTGYRVTIDNFGPVGTPVAMLQRLPIDSVKIDASFVRAMGPGGSEQEIVRALAALADSLAWQVVAEGVETQPQADALRRLGVTFAQGFHLGEPLEPDLATSLLDS